MVAHDTPSKKVSQCDAMHQKLGHLNPKDTAKVCQAQGIEVKESDCSQCTVCI